MDTLFSVLFSVILYGAVLAAVLKLFQIGTDLGEIKDILRDLKRNTSPLPTVSTPESPEALLQAISAESYPEPTKHP